MGNCHTFLGSGKIVFFAPQALFGGLPNHYVRKIGCNNNIILYISDRGCLSPNISQPTRSSQNLLREARLHTLESSEPEYYERAPPATLPTSGGPDLSHTIF